VVVTQVLLREDSNMFIYISKCIWHIRQYVIGIFKLLMPLFSRNQKIIKLEIKQNIFFLIYYLKIAMRRFKRRTLQKST